MQIISQSILEITAVFRYIFPLSPPRFTGISMHCCCSDLENIQNIFVLKARKKNDCANCVYKPKALKCYLVCTETLLYHIAGMVIEVKATPFAFKLQLGTQKGCNIM